MCPIYHTTYWVKTQRTTSDPPCGKVIVVVYVFDIVAVYVLAIVAVTVPPVVVLPT
jgi:hypothetical protein